MAGQNADALEKLHEEYEDSLFRLVMHHAAEKEGGLFLKEAAKLKAASANRPSAEATAEFERKLAAYGKRKRSQEKKRVIRRFINKAAVFFLLLIVVFSAALVSVQAFRVKVMNFLVDIQPEYTSFQIKNNASESSGEKLTVNWTNTYLPTYIPAGYEVDSFTYTEPLKEITYRSQKNKNSLIDFSENDSSNNVEIDTENASELKTVFVNGHKGTLVVKNSQTTVAWEMDNHIFVVCTEESMEETLKIAQNVKFIK